MGDDAMDVEAAAPAFGMDMDVGGVGGGGGGGGGLPPPDAGAVAEARRVVVAFLKEHTAEEVVPENSRVVVVEAGLRLCHAFRSLLENGIRAAPIVDPASYAFVGMLTVSDICECLRYFYYESPDRNVHRGLEAHTIASWRAISKSPEVQVGFRYVDAEASLFDACRMLRDMHIHRLPILSDASLLLCTLEHWRVLSFVHKHLAGHDRPGPEALAAQQQAPPPPPLQQQLQQQQHAGMHHHALQHAQEAPPADLFNLSLQQLRIGTFGNMVTVNEHDTLLHALEMMDRHNLSAVPVVDGDLILRNVYSRTDISALGHRDADPINLDQTLVEVLAAIRTPAFIVHTCRRSDTLRVIFELFESSRKHRLYVVSEHGRAEGVLSLSDLLAYFLEGF